MAEISVDQAADRTVMIRLTGELDLHGAMVLRYRLLTAVQLARTDVEVNVADVSFLDCAGIGLLVEAWRCAVAHGQTMTVAHPRHHSVSRVLDLLSATLPFPVCVHGTKRLP